MAALHREYCEAMQGLYGEYQERRQALDAAKQVRRRSIMPFCAWLRSPQSGVSCVCGRM